MIGIADRIFARVGASDELSRGQSTFMVEMTETARILNTATERSLVILDEIGRGTSTYDGVSLAWSIVEYLHDQINCRTLFATHYHELTDLSSSLPSVRNLNVAVKEWEDKVIFLHKIIPLTLRLFKRFKCCTIGYSNYRARRKSNLTTQLCESISLPSSKLYVV